MTGNQSKMSKIQVILDTLQAEVHDAWEAQNSEDATEWDAYGKAYDKAMIKAEHNIQKLIAQSVIDEFTALIDYLDRGAVDDFTSQRWIDERIAELKSYRSVD